MTDTLTPSATSDRPAPAQPLQPLPRTIWMLWFQGWDQACVLLPCPCRATGGDSVAPATGPRTGSPPKPNTWPRAGLRTE